MEYFEHLFSPITIRGIELRNRVVMSAMASKLLKDGKVTDEFIAYHVARAKGGLGLGFVETCNVHRAAHVKKYASLDADEYIEGYKKLTDAVHAAGGKIGIQLYPGGLAVSRVEPGAKVVIPSDYQIAPLKAGTSVTESSGVNEPLVTYPGATKEDIDEVVTAFGEAAARAVKAGFDVLEIHAGHGYGIHFFLSAGYNHRTDEYGGSLENRARFLFEIIDEVRRNIPETMPIFMRISSQDDGVENGLTVEDMAWVAGHAKEHGVDVVNVSRGNLWTSVYYEGPPIDIERGFNVENAAKIKAGSGMITVATGRINDPYQAEEIISSGKADMVVMARAHLADPEFCNKAKCGHPEDIIRCVGCNEGCNDASADPKMGHITCLMNPKTGRELEFEGDVTDTPKNVLIVGGGIAGLEAGIVLKERGHKPVIVERTNIIGGQFNVAGEAPRKSEFKEAMRLRAAYAEKIGVEIRRNTEFTPALLDVVKADEVIIAIGSEPRKLNIPNPDNIPTWTAIEALTGKAPVAENMVVVGGGLTGMEAAEYLRDKGANVTVVELLPDICNGMGAIRKAVVTMKLKESGIVVYTSASCQKFEDGKVFIEKDAEIHEALADAVVYAVGPKPRDPSAITAACDERKIPYHLIGDAVEVRRALENCADGADIALTI